MFEFIMDDLQPQTLPVEKAEISLFAHVPPWQNRIALYVEISASATDVLPRDGSQDPCRIAPTF